MIIHDDKVPTNWEQFHCLPLQGQVCHSGQGLREQAMKILERFVNDLMRKVVSFDDSQFSFGPGRELQMQSF